MQSYAFPGIFGNLKKKSKKALEFSEMGLYLHTLSNKGTNEAAK
jgi:hypothetical protein